MNNFFKFNDDESSAIKMSSIVYFYEGVNNELVVYYFNGSEQSRVAIFYRDNTLLKEDFTKLLMELNS